LFFFKFYSKCVTDTRHLIVGANNAKFKRISFQRMVHCFPDRPIVPLPLYVRQSNRTCSLVRSSLFIVAIVSCFIDPRGPVVSPLFQVFSFLSLIYQLSFTIYLKHSPLLETLKHQQHLQHKIIYHVFYQTLHCNFGCHHDCIHACRETQRS
jgi:hypothetical protein